jgi:hypothetical protein
MLISKVTGKLPKRPSTLPWPQCVNRELEIYFHPYGEDSPRLAAGRIQSREPEATAKNLRLIAEARMLRGERLNWAERIESLLLEWTAASG